MLRFILALAFLGVAGSVFAEEGKPVRSWSESELKVYIDKTVDAAVAEAIAKRVKTMDCIDGKCKLAASSPDCACTAQGGSCNCCNQSAGGSCASCQGDSGEASSSGGRVRRVLGRIFHRGGGRRGGGGCSSCGG